MEDKYLSKAKRIDNGDWLVGYVVKYGYTGKEKYYIVPSYASDLYAIEIDPSTICRSTGLKDKNDKLIWENDIISHKYAKNYSLFGYTEKRKNYVIKWDNTMVYCGFRYHNGRNIFPLKRGTISNGDDEVIGNIFDNPELLESEEK